MAYFCVVWCCINKQIWLQKKSSEKMKCVVMWLNMCCFIIERHQIRVWAVKVGFDPRQIAHTVTYMDISTSSCSLKYQLSFKARMVSVGWVGSKWLDSECKKGTYLDISPVSPLWWKTKFHPIRFSASQTIPHYKISTPVVFWGEKRPWVERGGSLRKYSCQKMNWYSAQTTGGVRLAPNFVNHLLMLFHYGVHQKSHISRPLLIWPPL